MRKFVGFKVFSATMFRERALLDEKVNRWIAEHPNYSIIDILVVQSSDLQFHCVSMIIEFKYSL